MSKDKNEKDNSLNDIKIKDYVINTYNDYLNICSRSARLKKSKFLIIEQ